MAPYGAGNQGRRWPLETSDVLTPVTCGWLSWGGGQSAANRGTSRRRAHLIEGLVVLWGVFPGSRARTFPQSYCFFFIGSGSLTLGRRCFLSRSIARPGGGKLFSSALLLIFLELGCRDKCGSPQDFGEDSCAVSLLRSVWDLSLGLGPTCFSATGRHSKSGHLKSARPGGNG